MSNPFRAAALQMPKLWAGFPLPEQDCLLCAGRARGAVICAACEAALPLLASSRCERCAIPVPSARICGECLARPPAFDGADAVYAYRFPLDRLVGRFKYAGDLAAGRWLAVRLAQRVRALVRPDLLVAPPIPPNRGNVIRLCANAGARLPLVEPLGFSIDDRDLRRAGLDYHELTVLRVHSDWNACLAALDSRRLFAFTRHAQRRYDEESFREGDALVFGPETAGLPEEIVSQFLPERRLRLPMRLGNRSLNLSNAVAVAVYEAGGQNGFAGPAGA